MEIKKDTIFGKALKINNIYSAKDIVNNNYTESYHNIRAIIPFEDTMPNFLEEVFSKKILVANENFGFGSSKELPALTLKQSGITVIVAKSFFASFYKNAFNLGLLCLQANTDHIQDSYLA